MMITTKGQVTIPQQYREMFGLMPHTEAEFVPENGKLVLQPAKPGKNRGESIIEHFRRYAKPEFQTGLTTDEIMVMTRGEDWKGE